MPYANPAEQKKYTTQYRMRNKKKAVDAVRRWRNDFKERDPEGYKAYRRDEHDKYLQTHGEEIRSKSKVKRDQVRQEAITAYGGKCSCPNCGETRYEFLTIDHIEGRGYFGPKGKTRRRDSNAILQWLKKHGWPKDDYRLLCMNCNLSHGLYGYCPHDSELLAA